MRWSAKFSATVSVKPESARYETEFDRLRQRVGGVGGALASWRVHCPILDGAVLHRAVGMEGVLVRLAGLRPLPQRSNVVACRARDCRLLGLACWFLSHPS